MKTEIRPPSEVFANVRNALTEYAHVWREIVHLRADMACENTPTRGCECPGCELAQAVIQTATELAVLLAKLDAYQRELDQRQCDAPRR